MLLPCTQGREDTSAPQAGSQAVGPPRTGTIAIICVERLIGGLLMASLSCVEAPLDCRDTWQRSCDELAESDSEGPEDDSDLCAGLLRRRPDALAFRWGSKSVMILEFTTERYLRLGDKLLRCLGGGCQWRW